jgi:hypothetical protein
VSEETIYKTIPVRLEKGMHRALVIYALDHETTQTAVIREALAAKLSITLAPQQIGDDDDGQSESKGNEESSTRKTRKRKGK